MSRGRPWSAEDAQRLRRLVAAGLTDGEIAEAMARHPDLIRRRRTEAGLRPGQSRAATIALMRVNRRRQGKKIAGRADAVPPDPECQRENEAEREREGGGAGEPESKREAGR